MNVSRTNFRVRESQPNYLKIFNSNAVLQGFIHTDRDNIHIQILFDED